MIFKIIIIFLVIATSIILFIVGKNNSDKLSLDNLEEGFKSRKLEKFKSTKKRNKDYYKGSRVDRIKQKEKMMDIVDKPLFASEGIQNNVDREDYTNVFNIHKKGSKASMSRVQSHLYDYYKKFDEERFKREPQSIIDSLGKWKYFKEEFYNIFKY